jgi:hypothetical protein
MLRHLSVLFPLALSSLLVACSAGTTTTTGDPSPTGSSTSSTDPTTPAKDGGGSTASALGPSCKAYVACCEELAQKSPQVAASCDSVKTQIEKAQSSGVSTSTYESACKSGVASFKSAGYCK